MNHIELKNKTILITGAAGFIGANLVMKLIKTGEPMKLNTSYYYADITTAVIAGFKGSTAQAYADAFGLSFNQLTRYGDANLDGKVGATDATLTQMHIAELVTLEGEALNNADVNDYGGVTIADVTIVQNVIAEVVDYITLFEPKG